MCECGYIEYLEVGSLKDSNLYNNYWPIPQVAISEAALQALVHGCGSHLMIELTLSCWQSL